jgi:hypothetical protein
LLTWMTGNSLHMQWPLTSQLHGSVSQREQLVFCCGSNSTPSKDVIFTCYSGCYMAFREKKTRTIRPPRPCAILCHARRLSLRACTFYGQ